MAEKDITIMGLPSTMRLFSAVGLIAIVTLLMDSGNHTVVAQSNVTWQWATGDHSTTGIEAMLRTLLSPAPDWKSSNSFKKYFAKWPMPVRLSTSGLENVGISDDDWLEPSVGQSMLAYLQMLGAEMEIGWTVEGASLVISSENDRDIAVICVYDLTSFDRAGDGKVFNVWSLIDLIYEAVDAEWDVNGGSDVLKDWRAHDRVLLVCKATIRTQLRLQGLLVALQRSDPSTFNYRLHEYLKYSRSSSNQLSVRRSDLPSIRNRIAGSRSPIIPPQSKILAKN